MHKKAIHLLAMLFGAWPFLLAQQPAVDSFPEAKAREIMTVLAGDSLRGRGNLTEDLLKAAKFIIHEFNGYGLKPLPEARQFFWEFQPYPASIERRGESLQWNGAYLRPEEFIYLAAEPGGFAPKELASFTVVHVDSFSANILDAYNDVRDDLLIWTENTADWLEAGLSSGGLYGARLIVKAKDPPQSIRLVANTQHYNTLEYNIAGLIRGKSKPDELIVFSAHYDHEGIKKGKDSIMNGANDNASGTTALLMLARYFAMRNDNERTLVFIAFAGEEIGLKGSSAMTKVLPLDKIKAGINLEMLGYPQYGKKKVYITGEKYSSLPAFFRKKMTAEGIRVLREPNEEKMLFARSDNFPFFRKGVPFHTIMASDDDEPCYHRPCDEPDRIDISNLCFITRAIAKASRDLISGLILKPGVIQPDFQE